MKRLFVPLIAALAVFSGGAAALDAATALDLINRHELDGVPATDATELCTLVAAMFVLVTRDSPTVPADRKQMYVDTLAAWSLATVKLKDPSADLAKAHAYVNGPEFRTTLQSVGPAANPDALLMTSRRCYDKQGELL